MVPCDSSSYIKIFFCVLYTSVKASVASFPSAKRCQESQDSFKYGIMHSFDLAKFFLPAETK